MKFRTILLFGAPGAGKGTQGKILGTIPNFFHMACGDVFRNLSIDSPLGRVFVEYSSQGQLVPDKYTIQLWNENLQGNIAAGRFQPDQDTLVLDGIPRNAHQAEILNDTLDVRGVFNLSCSNLDKLVERLQRRALKENRLDDANLDTIRQRLKVYESETEAVLDFYGPKRVHTIDSTQPPHRVLRDILDIIDTF